MPCETSKAQVQISAVEAHSGVRHTLTPGSAAPPRDVLPNRKVPGTGLCTQEPARPAPLQGPGPSASARWSCGLCWTQSLTACPAVSLHQNPVFHGGKHTKLTARSESHNHQTKDLSLKILQFFIQILTGDAPPPCPGVFSLGELCSYPVTFL